MAYPLRKDIIFKSTKNKKPWKFVRTHFFLCSFSEGFNLIEVNKKSHTCEESCSWHQCLRHNKMPLKLISGGLFNKT